MSSNGPTLIISAGDVAADPGRPDSEVPSAVPARLKQVTDALAAGAAAGAAAAARSTGLRVVRSADPTVLGVRQAALAAALQEWSGATCGTLRTTALAVLAASRTARVRQEAPRASHRPDQETVFEAFCRGVEGRPAPDLLTGPGDQQ